MTTTTTIVGTVAKSGTIVSANKQFVPGYLKPKYPCIIRLDSKYDPVEWVANSYDELLDGYLELLKFNLEFGCYEFDEEEDELPEGQQPLFTGKSLKDRVESILKKRDGEAAAHLIMRERRDYEYERTDIIYPFNCK